MSSSNDRTVRLWLGIAILFTILWALGLVFFGPRPPEPSLEGSGTGEPASYAWTFLDLQDRPATFSQFKGKVVFLNIWATWCGPCVEELPSLAALAPRAARDGIVVLPVSVDRGGAAAVRAFYASHGVDGLPIWNDPDGTASGALGLRGVPTTFLLDAQGREVAKLEGAAHWNADGVLGELRKLVR